MMPISPTPFKRVLTGYLVLSLLASSVPAEAFMPRPMARSGPSAIHDFDCQAIIQTTIAASHDILIVSLAPVKHWAAASVRRIGSSGVSIIDRWRSTFTAPSSNEIFLKTMQRHIRNAARIAGMPDSEFMKLITP